jgi:hypothetical protein
MTLVSTVSRFHTFRKPELPAPGDEEPVVLTILINMPSNPRSVEPDFQGARLSCR